MFQRPAIALLLVLSAASWALAATPNTMNYQGLLTDGGAPVANGSYSVVFTIYDAPALGTSKWTETRNVTTLSGLFTVVLGTVDAIEDTVFNGSGRWLGIAVDGDPEMTPRTALSSVPYAARISTVDGASGGTITGATTVNGNDGGNQLSVTNSGLGRGGFFQIANGANTEPAVQGTHVGSGPGGSFFSDGGGPGIVATATGGTAADLQGRVLVGGDVEVSSGADSVIQIDAGANILRNWGLDGNGENYRLWGPGFGQLYLHTSNVANTRMVEVSAPSSGGEIELHNSAGADYIKLDGGETGDLAAQLPVDALNAMEMLDEPGVASNKDATFNLSGTVQLRTIICPAAGYVLAIGTGSVEVLHVNGVGTRAEMYVSDTAGSITDQPQTTFYISTAGVTGVYTSPFTAQGIFAVNAGVNTFYLRGVCNVTATALETNLSLVYFPTAYGTVVSNVLPLPGDSPAEISMDENQERAAAEQQSLERLTRELAVQQAKLTALAAQVEELQAATNAADAD